MASVKSIDPKSITAGSTEKVFTESQALYEAGRCLQCYDPPCSQHCPAGIVIPRFIRMIRTGNFRGSAEVVRYANPMALSCGLACPDKTLCASACKRQEIDEPVEIRRLHRFVTEWEERNKPRNPFETQRVRGKVAIVGAGPAGLTCASELRRHGIKVTLFDKHEKAGGVLASVIPSYRIPNSSLKQDVNWALGSGRYKMKQVVVQSGKSVSDIDSLMKKFDAVFAAPGLAKHKAQIPGDDLTGVVVAHDWLTLCRRRGYKSRIGREVIVLGGGNVAVDAAIAAVRCGQVSASSPTPNVQILYRRTRPQMPAWESEIKDAEKAGVSINYLIIPLEFQGAGDRLTGLKVCRARLSEMVVKGRPRPVAIPESEFIIPCDQAIMAMGMGVNRDEFTGLIYSKYGFIRSNRKTGLVKENLLTGGDAAGADQTIATAVRDGKTAAETILKQLREK